MRPIFLCGFMGAENLLWERSWRKMGCQCVDLDKYIEDTQE
ncbi:MAG: hypothetical protein ACLTCP_07420 [Ruminococcus bicirculans (ex Wegman et al. 2014)]